MGDASGEAEHLRRFLEVGLVLRVLPEVDGVPSEPGPATAPVTIAVDIREQGQETRSLNLRKNGKVRSKSRFPRVKREDFFYFLASCVLTEEPEEKLGGNKMRLNLVLSFPRIIRAPPRTKLGCKLEYLRK